MMMGEGKRGRASEGGEQGMSELEGPVGLVARLIGHNLPTQQVHAFSSRSLPFPAKSKQ